jgi:hypothetical protein
MIVTWLAGLYLAWAGHWRRPDVAPLGEGGICLRHLHELEELGEHGDNQTFEIGGTSIFTRDLMRVSTQLVIADRAKFFIFSFGGSPRISKRNDQLRRYLVPLVDSELKNRTAFALG